MGVDFDLLLLEDFVFVAEVAYEILFVGAELDLEGVLWAFNFFDFGCVGCGGVVEERR